MLMQQHTSHSLFYLTVQIVVFVSGNEANRVQSGHTNWWDHSRRRIEPSQRQYLSRNPQGLFERGQQASQGQGLTYSTGQGHEVDSAWQQEAVQQRHHQTSQIHSQQFQSHRDSLNRANVGQGHRDTASKGHANRDNVGQYGDNAGQGHGANQDNVEQSHIHFTRDNSAHNRDSVRRNHQATRGDNDHGASRVNVPESHRLERDNVKYTEHATTQRTPHKGQSSPQCSYSFVVNELDSSKCPMLLQQLQLQQQQQQHNQEHQRSQSPHFQSDQDILSKYYDSLSINKEIEVLIRKMDSLENTLLREVAKNRELENDILELENKVKRHEKVVEFHDSNITNIATVVKRGEIMQQKQMGYWKNVDTKLSGVMLDVVELNNRLDRQDSIMQLNDEAAKSIYVQSTGQQTCTGIKNATRFKDCEDLYHNGHKRSGVYYITPIYTSCPIPVYCDMETPPGGWLVIQRRMDGSLSFNRTWAQYRHGFGKVGGEHWIGNDNLFLLTNQLHYALRVDLYDFYNSRVYAEYKSFRIDGERDRYMLHVGNHTGTAPDGLGNHDKVKFSTPDQDHDEWMDYHCAKEWAAGWWFNNCWFVILNGPYYNVTDVKYRGISWNDWKSEQLKHVEMKIRPAGF